MAPDSSPEKGSKHDKPEGKWVWKNVFVGVNKTTDRPYFERRKVFVPSQPESPPSPKKESRNLPRQIPGYERGNYTADIVSEAMEKEEEEREKRMRDAMGLPPIDEEE